MPVHKFCCTAPALPFVFPTLEHEVANALQVKRAVRSRAKVVKVSDKENVERAKAFSKVQLCPGTEPSHVYGEKMPPVSKFQEVGARQKKLLSSMVSTGKAKGKPETCSAASEEDGVQKVETEETENQ